MQFFAILAKHTQVHKTWRDLSRVSGDLYGVTFKFDGTAYVSEALPPEKLAEMDHDPRLTLVAITEPTGTVKPVPPIPEPEMAERYASGPRLAI